MAITYGFFDSQTHDRSYDASDMNRMFDGIITDGVFQNIGDEFTVSVSTGLTVLVGSGRAFFNHTWLYNDGKFPVTLETTTGTLNRIDAIVLNIDTTIAERKGTITIVKGEQANNPVKPTLVKDNGLYQYALAYITIKSGVTEITDDLIEYVVGNEETPYVTAMPSQMDVDNITAEYESSFDEYFIKWSQEKSDEFAAWFATVVNQMNATQIGQIQAAILGKEDAPLILTDILSVGKNTLQFTNNRINDESMIEVYTNPYGASLINMTQIDHTLYLTFGAYSTNILVKVLVRN